MIALALVKWWYGTGWAWATGRVRAGLKSVLGFFSIGMLLRTLFDPFRQISAGRTTGPLADQFRAWSDRTFSRFVGAFVRGTFIISGSIVALFALIFGAIELILWPLVPLLPIFGMAAAVMGWAP